MPTDEDAVFRFNGSMDSSKTYTFKVRQTYSNGKVVDWTGSESSDTPAPTVEAVSRSRRRLELDADDRRARGRRDRRPARDHRPGDERAAADVRRGAGASGGRGGSSRCPRPPGAHAALLRTVPGGERDGQHAAAGGAAHLQRAGRAALRHRLGHRRRRPAGDERPAASSAPGAPQTLVTPLQARARRLVPRLLARDLGRRASGARRVHVRGRAEPGAAAAVPVPSLSETAATPRLLVARWVVFLSVLAALGLFVLRALIARPVARAVRGTSLRALTVAFAVAVGRRAGRDPGLRRLVATAQFSLRSAFDLGAIVPVRGPQLRARLPRPRARARAVRRSPPGSRSASTGPSGSGARWSSSLALRALAAAAAALVLPALAGHAGQKSPRGLALPLDWLHLAAGSRSGSAA